MALMSNAQFLELPCDVLIPAALSNVITATNAHKLQCKVPGFSVPACSGFRAPGGPGFWEGRGTSTLTHDPIPKHTHQLQAKTCVRGSGGSGLMVYAAIDEPASIAA